MSKIFKIIFYTTFLIPLFAIFIPGMFFILPVMGLIYAFSANDILILKIFMGIISFWGCLLAFWGTSKVCYKEFLKDTIESLKETFYIPKTELEEKIDYDLISAQKELNEEFPGVDNV